NLRFAICNSQSCFPCGLRPAQLRHSPRPPPQSVLREAHTSLRGSTARPAPRTSSGGPPMPDARRFRLDFVAGALLLVGLLVALCVFSYTPADAPGTTVYPPPLAPDNLVGPGG